MERSDGSAAARPGTRTRATRQRAAVDRALQDIDGFVSAGDLHTLIAQHGERIGLTTVYRTLQALSRAGEIDQLVHDDGRVLYRRCGQGQGHHHHLICRQCGATYVIDGGAVEGWADAVAAAYGFVNPTHTLDVFADCAGCARSPATAVEYP